ncbi:flavodoxin-like fold family protein [Nocardiopsis alba ATCC BAA-2165]|uniref:Flavodoxin-like fold family protein n=1 Tax=Nocardiopsis alba (strain ATCC BAA-2165 / BE74) TaxID=1205910 RepID=J7LFL2_NOCAA|nr:flavodoxin-like fold family protein [Nocardiopsis alba ATCC BAA-2165]
MMGGVFGGEHGFFEDAALTGRRAMLLFTTGGSAEAFESGGAFGPMDDFLFHIRRGMLEFVGYEVLDPVVTHKPVRMTDEERGVALRRVERAIDDVAGAATAPIRP